MTMQRLYESIGQRWRPEDVAKLVLELRGADYDRRERKILEQAAKSGWSWSSMSNRFAKADGLDRQIAVARQLFPGVEAPARVDDVEAVQAYLGALNSALGKAGPDFLADRLNRSERRTDGLKLGHRAYNKRFRLVQRMEDKLRRWLRQRTMRELAQMAKTRLACKVRWEDFSADVDTACFVAYQTARLGLRSLFTWGSQPRAYDRVADLLLARCLSSERASFWAIAQVHPAPEVLERLGDEQKGQLVAAWFQVMHTASLVLEEAARANELDLERLIVRRGNDSSTWNEAAGAYNKARDGWISTLYALGMADLLERFAPGKALRLMAADVVFLHSRFGSGGLEPDTAVWQELPLPWEVVLGRAQCRRRDIVAACQRHGVEGKGWIAPRPKSVAPFTPTPELVHGVTVGSPALAAILRQCGYFSGPSKGLKALAPVDLERTLVADTVVVTEASAPADRPRH